jgi:hypothetical protein
LSDPKSDQLTTAGVAARLRDIAEVAENIGRGQYARSARFNGPGYTEFSNALDWGQRARFYRDAARDIENMTDEEFLPSWAKTSLGR